MIKVGSKVSLNENFTKVGTVINVEFVKPKKWMVGGAASDRQVCTVQFKDGSTAKYYANELRQEFD